MTEHEQTRVSTILRRSPQQANGTRSPRGGMQVAISVGLAYLGAGYMLPALLTFDLPLLSVYTVAGVAIGVAGLAIGNPVPVMSRYLLPAAFLACAIVLSVVSVWEVEAFIWALSVLPWLLVAVPGLILLLSEEPYRRALIIGLGAGAAFIEISWLLDTFSGNFGLVSGAFGTTFYFLGTNRNDLDGRMIFVLPLVLWGTGAARVWKWAIVALTGAWLVSNAGRLGPAGLALIGCTYVLMQPRLSRRVRAAMVAGLAGTVLLAAAATAPGQGLHSADRLLGYFQGERLPWDQDRALGTQMAIEIGFEHPFFGAGYRRVGGIGYETVPPTREPDSLAEASSAITRARVVRDGPHDLYAWYFATTGLPGILALFALLMSALICAWRTRASPDVQASATALIAVLLVAALIRTRISIFYFPLALLFADAGAYLKRLREEASIAGDSVVGAAGRASD